MLYHLATHVDWDARTGSAYSPAGLATEGFVHCSAAHQLLPTANGLFAGRTDLILLTIEPDKLASEVVWEDLYGNGEDHPHVYGPIDLEAVVRAEPFTPDDRGHFHWEAPAHGEG